MMIDTHCHLNFDAYDSDLATVLEKARQQGVTRYIIPAVDLETSRSALRLSEGYEGVYLAVGIHPNSTADFVPSMLADFETLASAPKVIAIGEIGLDYYWDDSPKSQQFAAFEAQLELAARLELPVIIHNREASEDVMRILESWVTTLPNSLKDRAGVLHSFSASWQIAERALAAGFYLGFTGPITFKKADELRSIARQTPLDRILVETDAPFLTPEPYRGKRNTPEYIPYVVDRIAALKSLTQAEMASITSANAERLFKLPKS